MAVTFWGKGEVGCTENRSFPGQVRAVAKF